jgi:hypothetical protein
MKKFLVAGACLVALAAAFAAGRENANPPADSSRMPSLINDLKDSDPAHRRDAAVALGAMGPAAQSAYGRAQGPKRRSPACGRLGTGRSGPRSKWNGVVRRRIAQRQ